MDQLLKTRRLNHFCNRNTPTGIRRFWASRWGFLIFGAILVTVSGSFASASEEYGGLSRISFSRQSDGTGTIMRVHLNSASAELNSKIQEEDGFIAITIFQSRIDTRCILDSPQGSIRSYRIDQIDQNVVIRIHSGGVHLFAKVYRELNSNDLLVHLIPNLQKTLQFAEANEAHRAGRRDKEKS